MLTTRQKDIFSNVVKQYIADAHPVGSQVLLKEASLGVSPATVRNEMLELERHGYLFQPHTSAGRIPTDKGWRFYLDNFLSERQISKPVQEELRKIVRAYHHSRTELVKHLAQAIADASSQAVFVAHTPHDTYYTGISKLFNQPEFDEVDLIRAISAIVDHLDEAMPDFFPLLKGEYTILVGRDNPVSDACGLILTSIPRHTGLIGMLGPVRQDYDGNVSLIRFTRNLLTA